MAAMTPHPSGVVEKALVSFDTVGFESARIFPSRRKQERREKRRAGTLKMTCQLLHDQGSCTKNQIHHWNVF